MGTMNVNTLAGRALYAWLLAQGQLLAFPVAAAAEPPLVLPAPHLAGGSSLMEALKNRHSSRDFAPRPLPPQALSNLLWAAFGVNRPASGGRTAPSAHNAQEMDIYVVTAPGSYRYDAAAHRLQPVRSGDLRALTGTQHFVRDAPVSLVYVADLSRFPMDSDETRRFYAAADAGHISENAYLFCASEGLAVVVHASIERRRLAQALGLRASQWIVLAQAVGYPK